MTFCDQCRHLFIANKGDQPFRWMCAKHPRKEGFGFVTQDKWDNMPPYLFCKDVNGGACPLYEEHDGHQ